MKACSSKVVIAVFLGLLAGCSTVQPEAEDNWIGFTESGQASYYSDYYQNRPTASGELYSHEKKTAAHRELPFGSNVRVTNVDNGESVIVRINDRGPFVEGRIIDLSRSAFSDIGSISSGTLAVEIEVVK